MSFRQGEIYWANLDSTTGREQRGRRPVLVISRDELNRLPLTVLVMVGTGAERLSQHYPTDLWVAGAECGLPKDTVFLGLQIRSLDPSRLGARVGRIAGSRLAEVRELIRYVVGDDRP